MTSRFACSVTAHMTSSDMDTVVIDTNVFIAALMSAEGASRRVLRLALRGDIVPLFGNALLLEYEDVLWNMRTS